MPSFLILSIYAGSFVLKIPIACFASLFSSIRIRFEYILILVKTLPPSPFPFDLDKIV
jgi:hypothetical protein